MIEVLYQPYRTSSRTRARELDSSQAFQQNHSETHTLAMLIYIYIYTRTLKAWINQTQQQQQPRQTARSAYILTALPRCPSKLGSLSHHGPMRKLRRHPIAQLFPFAFAFAARERSRRRLLTAADCINVPTSWVFSRVNADAGAGAGAGGGHPAAFFPSLPALLL